MKPLTLVTLRCPQRCFLGIVVATDEGPVAIMRTLNVKLDTAEIGYTRRVEGTRTWAVRLDKPQLLLLFGCQHGGGTTAVADLRALVAEVRVGTTRAGVDHILRSSPVL